MQAETGAVAVALMILSVLKGNPPAEPVWKPGPPKMKVGVAVVTTISTAVVTGQVGVVAVMVQSVQQEGTPLTGQALAESGGRPTEMLD